MSDLDYCLIFLALSDLTRPMYLGMISNKVRILFLEYRFVAPPVLTIGPSLSTEISKSPVSKVPPELAKHEAAQHKVSREMKRKRDADDLG